MRKVRIGDARKIINILNPMIKAGIYTVLDQPITLPAEKMFIANFPKQGIFLVAESGKDKRIVGFQVLEPFGKYSKAFKHVATLGTYVELSKRRQGIGTYLSKATFKAAIDKGYEKLFTYVRRDNPSALNFYKKLGFRIAGIAKRQARFGNKYVDEVIIEKFL
ncbi:MAG: GNAT family N-acetyltransferase [candidate division WOR-3 bacterium]|nr:GNAT family N-acetyltransferase [candidate division WOR-3 bacterium]